MYEKELISFGLSEKESKVYLAALELGAETAQNLAKKAGINRPTTYVIIDSLKKRGLMSEVETGKKTHYLAETPERLEGLLNLFETELQYKKNEIKRILPMLSEIFATAGEKPRVRFFEGREGIKAIQDDFLTVKSKLVEGIVNLDKISQFLPNFEDTYSEKRVKKGIKSNIIYCREAGPMMGASDSSKLREAKFLSTKRFPISADITIYDDKIALLAYKAKPISVIIENKEIAETLRSIFYILWERL
jgi:HTH-type transcriptional regulator, sugar sensing transcriptional regulator